MKRLISLLFLTILLGAGCAGTNSSNVAQWWVTFDLPQEWQIVPHYQTVSDDLSAELVTADLSDVVVQSTDRHILMPGKVVENESFYVTEDYTYMRVYRYSTRRVIPEDAQEIGDGFYEQDVDGQINYWLDGEFAHYYFEITQDGQSADLAREVVLSAVEQNLNE